MFLFGVFLVVVVGIAPMLIYAFILAWFDRYEKEPLGLLAAAFLWGAVPAAVFSLIAELLLDVPISYFVDPAAATLVGTALVGPVIEEIFKGLALFLLVLLFRREIDSPLDGIIYGGLVGFGFAAVENVLYFASTLSTGGIGDVLTLGFLRAFLFGLNHALFTGLTGLGIALGRSARNRVAKIAAPLAGLALGITAHAIHNAMVTFGEQSVWPCLLAVLSDWGGVLILLVIIAGSMLKERAWIVSNLADEVAHGTLSRESYEIASSSYRRIIHRLIVLSTGDVARWKGLGRYYQALTELAFKKQRLARFAQEQDTAASVEQFRERVVLLGEQLAAAGE